MDIDRILKRQKPAYYLSRDKYLKKHPFGRRSKEPTENVNISPQLAPIASQPMVRPPSEILNSMEFLRDDEPAAAPAKTNYYTDNLNLIQQRYNAAKTAYLANDNRETAKRYMAAKTSYARMLRRPKEETTRNLAVNGGFSTPEKFLAAQRRAADMAKAMRDAAPIKRQLNNIEQANFYSNDLGEAELNYMERLRGLTSAERRLINLSDSGRPLKERTVWVPYSSGRGSKYYVSNGVLRGGPVMKLTEKRDNGLIPLNVSDRTLTKALATYYDSAQFPPTRVVMYLRGTFKAPKE